MTPAKKKEPMTTLSPKAAKRRQCIYPWQDYSATAWAIKPIRDEGIFDPKPERLAAPVFL